MGILIGIDLGSSHARVAVVEADTPRILPNRYGARSTPTRVGRTREGEWLVGDVSSADEVVTNFFGLLGRRFDDPAVLARWDIAPYELAATEGGWVGVQLGGRTWSPVVLCALVLRRLREDAERSLGARVDDAALACPSSFDAVQRRALRDAAALAGLPMSLLVSAPVAAGLAAGYREAEKLFVFDLGGGTLDVAVLEIGDGIVSVLAEDGVRDLGGLDVDRALVEVPASKTFSGG